MKDELKHHTRYMIVLPDPTSRTRVLFRILFSAMRFKSGVTDDLLMRPSETHKTWIVPQLSGMYSIFGGRILSTACMLFCSQKDFGPVRHNLT